MGLFLRTMELWLVSVSQMSPCLPYLKVPYRSDFSLPLRVRPEAEDPYPCHNRSRIMRGKRSCSLRPKCSPTPSHGKRKLPYHGFQIKSVILKSGYPHCHSTDCSCHNRLCCHMDSDRHCNPVQFYL